MLRFLINSWLAIFFLILAVECSQDVNRRKAQEALETQAKDTHHLKEHLMETLGMDDEAAEKYLNETNGEVQFFLMHDYDNNSKLDGLEILQGLSHHRHSEHEEGRQQETSIEDDEITKFVDMILEDQDRNNDGYIDYPEFVLSFRPASGHGGGAP